MELIRIDEQLPDTPLASEVVLHVRRHLRGAIRNQSTTIAQDLAHLFGFSRAEGNTEGWTAAAKASDPFQAGAAVALKQRGGGERVVTLGHDAAHLLECRRWLAARKTEDDCFAAIKASDLATLLELCKARDIACAKGVDVRGHDRFLPVLIQGQTGTGKELLAQAIHKCWAKAQGRPEAPFVAVQVGGMSTDLINDELFGHVRGAFTGAAENRQGRLRAADGGTLLIDEVGDLPPDAQVRLLRFLQTQTTSRIGEDPEQQLSVRIIAATWHDLDADVSAGKFRDDLLHRLRVGSGIVLPPLAAREGIFDEVLPALLAERRHVAQPLLTRSARDALAQHSWPGNLREFVGVLDEVVAVADGSTIRLEHLPPHLQRRYLQLPLHERALGVLLDEVDGQGLVDEHVTWRIAQIQASLSALPAQQNEQLSAVGQFLALLDDTSDDHQRAVGAVSRLLELDQVHRQAAIVSVFWERVLTVPLPPQIAHRVKHVVKEQRATRHTIEREIEAIKKSGVVDSNPWLRLLNEVQDLPLLRGTNTGELAKTMLAIVNIMKLVAPSMIETIRADAKAGGFAKLRERLLAWYKRSTAEDHRDFIEEPAAPGVPGVPPGRLTRAEWVRIAQTFPTQRAAVQATGYDPKTIAKYFAKHRVRNPWRGSAPARR